MAQLIPVNIEEEMKSSYLDYAMSVIVGRAIPDVRDGLKPVHRRILYAMKELGNDWNKPYKKSARVVGDVIGKYHPHGDTAVYESIVRMAQDFSTRYPLIDGQGNFGSIDGDPPAAMRYTEVRLSRFAHELLAELNYDTVDFIPNYDESDQEPVVLPARLPNLMVNGSSGIAVGMATNIPPHNLTEVIDGVIALIENPELSVEELMQIIPGPDFPTAGYIYGSEGIKQAYKTGKGIIQLRARAYIEKDEKRGKESIIITEIPYMVNKAKLIEKIAELVSSKKLEGIADLRDESNKEGIRIVIELKKNEIAQAILNYLYKHTQMQISFGIILLAIVNNRPVILNLKDMLFHFIQFREEVITRKSRFELKKAEERAHILEGFKKALDHIDEIISLIKKSPSPMEARKRLKDRFSFSDQQAQAILELRLQRLTALEREKIIEEYKKLIKEIARLKELLSNEKLLHNLIIEELTEIKNMFGDSRRTEIIYDTKEISIEDMIAKEDMVVTISHRGYVKRTPASLYRSQRRGGKGRLGMNISEDDFAEKIFVASTHTQILFFTESGKVFKLKVHELPQIGPASRGKAIVNLLNLPANEKISAKLPVEEFLKDRYVIMATKNGIVKKTELSKFKNVKQNGVTAIQIKEGDKLISAKLTNGDDYILVASQKGLSVHFHEQEVRSMGRNAQGVIGIRLKKGDHLVSMEITKKGATVLTVTENGYGKRTRVDEYSVHSRGTRGIITIRTNERNGDVVAVRQLNNGDDILIITDRGKLLRLRADDIPIISRNTMGVKLIDLEQEEKVVDVATFVEENNN
ncbi:MAG: DNA gyrase subunit A [Spirochaetes bacterium]|nr:MAG: DNA gyrase subunit A [Spirochaetota bacterium]